MAKKKSSKITPPKKPELAKISIIDYSEGQFQEKQAETIEECFQFRDTATVTWINIDVLQQDIIDKIGTHFNLHPLIVEDILNIEQRPKLEDFESHIFLVMKMFFCSENSYQIRAEQISLIFGKNFVISFQEREGDIFDPIRDRIRNAKGRIRKMGADYLVYALLDATIDNYFVIMEKLGEEIEAIEEVLMNDPSPKTLAKIHHLKRDMILLRKSVWPLREVVNSLERHETSLILKPTRIFLGGAYDHTIQVIDTIESFRDMVSGMIDIYLSSLSNRLNEVMKVLTIIATIFIPLTFISGIYGMNFNTSVSVFNMPELNWKYGYLFAWGIMAAVASIMIIYFKRRKWL